MTLFENDGIKSVMIPLSDYIELLESNLWSKKRAREEDSSWNYGIEELESKIQALKYAQ